MYVKKTIETNVKKEIKMEIEKLNNLFYSDEEDTSNQSEKVSQLITKNKEKNSIMKNEESESEKLSSCSEFDVKNEVISEDSDGVEEDELKSDKSINEPFKIKKEEGNSQEDDNLNQLQTKIEDKSSNEESNSNEDDSKMQSSNEFSVTKSSFSDDSNEPEEGGYHNDIGIDKDWELEDFKNPVGKDFPEYFECQSIPFENANESIFDFFFTKDIFIMLANETNIYARKKICKSMEIDNKTHNNIDDLIKKRWKDTNEFEMKSFLGITLLMGVIKKSCLGDYWAKDYKLLTPVFSSVMSKNRYQQMLRYFHISTTQLSKTKNVINKIDEMDKVYYLLEFLKQKWNIYKPPKQCLTVDESIISFKGKILFKEMQKRKKNKWAMKCWILVDSVSSYVHNIQVYTRQLAGSNNNLAETVVLELSENLPAGTKLFFDFAFTSVSLLESLAERRIAAIGMLHLCKQGVTKKFYSEHLKENETSCYRHKEFKNLNVVTWKERKKMCCMTNSLDILKIQNKPKSKKIDLLPNYNKYLHGINRIDHLTAFYTFKRNYFKWWKHFFFYLLEISILNAYIIYLEKCIKNPFTRKQFRLAVIERLISKNRREVALYKDKCNTKSHFPQHQECSNSCVWCSKQGLTKNKRNRVRSKYFCESCDVTLCILCFKPYHESLKPSYT